MTRAENKISPQVRVMMDEGLSGRLTVRQIQTRIRKNMGEKITLREITMRKEEYEHGVGKKKFFKQKGADMVCKFLEGAKEGADVSDLQAVLEQAVYFDCLRRYANDEDGFLESINTKDLLKITSDYQKLRLKRATGDGGNGIKVSAVSSLNLLDAVEESFSNDPELKKAFASRKPLLIEKMKTLFGKGEFDTAKEDYETMQKIVEKHELSKLAGSDSGGRGANGRATA